MRGFTAKLLATTALPSFAILLAPSLAFAVCTPNPATANNQSITCDSTTDETGGFSGSTFTGLTVNVQSNAGVTNTTAAPAISMLDGTVNVNNSATVGGTTGLGAVGINTLGIDITNAGTVTVQNNGVVTGLSGAGISIGGAGTVDVLAGGTVVGTNGAGVSVGGAATVTVGNGAAVTSSNASGVIVGSGTVNSDGDISVTGDNTVVAPIAGIQDPNGDITTTGNGTIAVNLTDAIAGTAGRDIYSGYTGSAAAIGIDAGLTGNTTVNTVNNASQIDVTSNGTNGVAIGIEGSGTTQLENFDTNGMTVTQTGAGGIAIGMNGSTDGAVNGLNTSITVNLNQTTAAGWTAPNANQGQNGTAIGIRIANGTGITPPASENLNDGAIAVNLNGSQGLGIGVALDSATQNFRMSSTGTIDVTGTGSNNTLFGIRGTPISGTNNLTITNDGAITLTAQTGSAATGISAGGDASVVNDTNGTIDVIAAASSSSAIGVDINDAAAGTGTFVNNGAITTSGGVTSIGVRVNGSVVQQNFTNNGTIDVTGTSAIGVDLGLGTAVNTGSITSTGGIGVRIDPQLTSATGPIFTNALNASITATGTAFQSISSGGYGNPLLDNAGTINSSNNSTNTVTITHGDNILNRSTGTISASGNTSNAIVISGPEFVGGKSVITNAGDITASLDAIVGTAFDEDVANTGTITGNLNLGDGTNTVTSSGDITGDVTTGSGNDTITSTAAITGSVNMGDGTNSLSSTGAAASIGVDVTFGTGDDTFTTDNQVGGNVDMGAGNNTLTATTANSQIGGNATFGDGNDTFTTEGGVGGNVAMGNGTNSLTSSNSIGGGVTFGTGDDTFTNSLDVANSVVFGDGTNVFHDNTANSAVGGDVTFGVGDDTVTNDGQISGSVTMGAGTNSLSNSSTGQIGTNVTAGVGDDTVHNSGTIGGNVDLSDGTNILTNDDPNNSNIGGLVSFGAGNDTFTNAGTVGSSVAFGAGTNTWDNSTATSNIGGDVTFGAGDDTGNNTGSVGGSVIFGDGTNSFTNAATGSVGTNVTFGAGADTFTNSFDVGNTVDLGGGNNTFHNNTTNSSVGTDVIAGAGNDTVTNDGAIGGNVNLGGGTNTFSNTNATSNVGGNLTTGAGDDTVTNLGTNGIGGAVSLGDGTNTLTNGLNATIGGDVTFGSGDDSLTNLGTISGNVDGGGGNNIFTAGANSTVGGNVTNFNQLIIQGNGNIQFSNVPTFQSTTIGSTINLISDMAVANTTVTSAGTLTGNAILTGNVTNNGTISPGDTSTNTLVGSIGVVGTFTQSSGGHMIIEFAGNNSDTVDVTGSAQLAGTLDLNVVLTETGISPGSTYTILSTTGGITGQFSTINTTTTKFFDIAYTQGTNTIQVTLNPTSFVLPVYNSNQRAVAQALTILQTASVGTASVFVNNLLFTDKTEAAQAIDQLIPQAALNMATPALVTHRAFLGSIAEKAREYGPDYDREGHWWAWASGFGQFGDVSSGGSSYGFSTGGVVSGATYGVNENTALGFVVGASRSDINVDFQPGNNNHRSIDAGLYGAYMDGPLSATATASFGYDRFETDRRINTGPAIEQAAGRVGGYIMASRFESAYALDAGFATVSPYLAGQVMSFHHGAYDETGAGTIGLHIAGERVTSVRSTLGFSAERTVEFGSGAEITFHAGAAWEREFGDRILSSRAAFLAAPTDTFEVTGITQDRNTANVVGGFKAALTHGVDLALRYEGNVGKTETVNRARADLTWRW